MIMQISYKKQNNTHTNNKPPQPHNKVKETKNFQ